MPAASLDALSANRAEDWRASGCRASGSSAPRCDDQKRRGDDQRDVVTIRTRGRWPKGVRRLKTAREGRLKTVPALTLPRKAGMIWVYRCPRRAGRAQSAGAECQRIEARVK